jgi:hypothetical protein
MTKADKICLIDSIYLSVCLSIHDECCYISSRGNTQTDHETRGRDLRGRDLRESL